MTKKLYYQRENIKEFTAAVIEAYPGKANVWNVILDQTAFYPEGGGQPSDTGTINGIKVLAVHEVSGIIVHETEEILVPGTRIHGRIDWDRRFKHMQLHTGEHILSGLVNRFYGYDNVGFHMGKDEVAIDFNGVLSKEQIWELELLANQVIYDNTSVDSFYPSEEDLKHLEYRSKKELLEAVRIVDIPGADRCACCGTHVSRTGEIGMIKTAGMVNYKGGVRMSLLCGITALADYERRMKQDAAISRLLSAKQNALFEAAEKMKLETEKKDEIIAGLYRRLIALKISAFSENMAPLLIFEQELPTIPLRHYCTSLYEGGRGSVVMICSGSGEAYHYVIGSSIRDMRDLSKALNQELGGRGGGSEVMAQGTFYATEEHIRSVFAKLVTNGLRNSIEI